MAEISDAELAVKNKAVALLDRMINDPTEGLAVKRKIKQYIPEANFPELGIIDTTTGPLIAELESQKKHAKSLEDRLNNWEQSQKDNKEEVQLQTQLDGIRKQYGFTVDGMQKVIDRMREKNNPDAESAAAWVASQERKAKPLSNSNVFPTALNLYGSNSEDQDWADLNKDPIKWADNQLVAMINEFNEQDAA